MERDQQLQVNYLTMQYALKYYEKGVLTEEDLAEIETWFEEPEEDQEENVTEETPETE